MMSVSPVEQRQGPLSHAVGLGEGSSWQQRQRLKVDNRRFPKSREPGHSCEMIVTMMTKQAGYCLMINTWQWCWNSRPHWNLHLCPFHPSVNQCCILKYCLGCTGRTGLLYLCTMSLWQWRLCVCVLTRTVTILTRPENLQWNIDSQTTSTTGNLLQTSVFYWQGTLLELQCQCQDKNIFFFFLTPIQQHYKSERQPMS